MNFNLPGLSFVDPLKDTIETYIHIYHIYIYVYILKLREIMIDIDIDIVYIYIIIYIYINTYNILRCFPCPSKQCFSFSSRPSGDLPPWRHGHSRDGLCPAAGGLRALHGGRGI
jgi:hypothetical protein